MLLRSVPQLPLLAGAVLEHHLLQLSAANSSLLSSPLENYLILQSLTCAAEALRPGLTPLLCSFQGPQ